MSDKVEKSPADAPSPVYNLNTPPAPRPPNRAEQIRKRAEERLAERLAALDIKLPVEGSVGLQWRRVLGEPIFLAPFTTDFPVLDIPGSLRLWQRIDQVPSVKVRAKCLGVCHRGSHIWVHLRVGKIARIVIEKRHLCLEDQQWLDQKAPRWQPSSSSNRNPLHARSWVDRSGKHSVEAEFLAYHPHSSNSSETQRISSLILQFGSWGDYMLKGPIWQDVATGLKKPAEIKSLGGTVFIRKTNGVRILVPMEQMSWEDIEYIQARFDNIHVCLWILDSPLEWPYLMSERLQQRETTELPPGTTPEERNMIYGDGVPDGPGMIVIAAPNANPFSYPYDNVNENYNVDDVPHSFSPKATNPPIKISYDTAATKIFKPLAGYALFEKKHEWNDKRNGRSIPSAKLLTLQAGYALPGVRAGFALPEVILERSSYPSVGDKIAVRLCNLKKQDLKYIEKATNTNLEDFVSFLRLETSE